LGVSATKEDVHKAVAALDEGLFPGAFCRIAEDVLGGDPEFCCAQHSDGAGTKVLVAYLVYRETGDVSVFRGVAQDSLVMNTDDLLCIGAVDRFLVANSIGRNSFYIPGEVIAQIIGGYEDCIRTLRSHGVEVASTGGETADLVDSVRTLVVDSTVATRLRRSHVIDNRGIRPGDLIVGLSSTGQATYEATPNSGIGSNGLTLARHCLLSKEYAQRYPESVAPEIDRSEIYRGPFHVDDEPSDLGMSVGRALSSPTRTYAPILREILSQHRADVHGVVHNTGGGQTKCKGFGVGVRYVKDNLFESPPLFRLIAEHGKVSWWEMYQTFNMGHRMELMVAPSVAERIVEISRGFGVAAQVVGRCERAEQNEVVIHSPFGTFQYPKR
jgi:phosphoribosylformylglycinamidine cyclo-ligase